MIFQTSMIMFHVNLQGCMTCLFQRGQPLIFPTSKQVTWLKLLGRCGAYDEAFQVVKKLDDLSNRKRDPWMFRVYRGYYYPVISSYVGIMINHHYLAICCDLFVMVK